jgi:hypothetical protein
MSTERIIKGSHKIHQVPFYEGEFYFGKDALVI